MYSRRQALKTLMTGAATISLSPSDVFASVEKDADGSLFAPRKGNIRHAVCRWTFSQLSLDELCTAAKGMGIEAIDLVGPADWPTLKNYGLHSSMCNGAEINLTDGFCEPNFHMKLIENYSAMIPKVGEAGYQNLICFSGNRRGMDDYVGMRNCAKALRELMPLCEKHGVTLVMELFNTQKGGHLDYMCDSTLWGVTLCDMVGSEHFKLLYDIYHMQLNEGNVIQTIRDYHTYFAHYHTAGVPGRNEIDDSQELYYPAIMRAIVATGFKGYVAQEFMPKAEDKLGSLRKAIDICDV